MIEDSFALVDLTTEGSVLWATIDNGPINLLTVDLMVELVKLGAALEADDDVLVVVLQSANPDFFIAHFDVGTLIASDRAVEPTRQEELNLFGVMCEMYRTMNKVTIAKIGGRVGGGGSELAMACDMRFGALGNTVVNQMEVPLGILPGGGGTQRLPGLIGQARAAEVILGAIDLDAETGERWGYFNRCLPPSDLDAHVDNLARRIGSFPPTAVRLAKASLVNATPDPLPGLIEESWLFSRLLADPTAEAAMTRFLEVGGQTPDGERRVASLSAEVASSGLW